MFLVFVIVLWPTCFSAILTSSANPLLIFIILLVYHHQQHSLLKSQFHSLHSNENVIKLIKKHHGLFYANPEKTLLPNIEFLKSIGVHTQQINTSIYTFPYFFFKSPENIRRCVDKADEMGVLRSSRIFIHAVKAVSDMSGETLELKFKSFRDMGFSEDDIFRVFRSYPNVFAVPTPKINKVVEVLLETGKYDMSCIVSTPVALYRSVERRYRPRIQVLKALERSCLITKWPSLSTLAVMSHERFVEKFVTPNMDEVGEALIEKFASSSSGKRNTRTGS